MGKSNTQITSFTAGEVSPLIRGRPDIAKYGSGAETVENFVVRPQGPLWRRHGTKFIGPTWENGTAVLIPFIFSESEAYLLELVAVGLETRMIIRDINGAALTVGSTFTITGAVQVGGTVEFTTSAPHTFSGGDIVQITGSSVLAYNGLWDVGAVGATTFRITTTFGGTATGSAQEAVQATGGIPWEVNELSDVSYAQSADTMFFCHKLYKPRKLERTSSTVWVMSEFTTVDGPYLDYDKTDTRLTVSNIVDRATLDGNASFAATTPFIAGDVGSFIEYFDDGEWYLAQIVARISASQATVDIIDNVKVGIHPDVRFSEKGGDDTRPGSRTLRPPPTPQPTPFSPYARYGPSRATPGVSPDDSPPVVPQDGVDRNANLTFDAAAPKITSSHRNVFDVGDVRKYIRIVTGTGGGAADSWRRITSFTSDWEVGLGVALTFKTYTYPTQSVTLRQASRTITATLTASAALFATTDVGRHVRLNYQGRWVYAKITAYTSDTVVTIQLFESFPRHGRNADRLANDGITDIWRLGAWYGEDTIGNYPGFVTFHEQRLVFAGSPEEPQTIWFSRPQDFNKMSPSEPDGTVADDNAINVTLASNRVNAITWLQSMRVLIVGTIGGEWQGRAASSISEPITPTNITFTEETTHGSSDGTRPVKVGSSVLFLQRSGQKLRELTYNFELDGWASRDLTIASEHILRKGTRGVVMAYQNEPHSIVWIRTASGTLAAMTYQREQEVLAWHYHTIGGNGAVGSIATIPDSNGVDQVYMVVTRTINGSSKKYIERIVSDDYPDSTSDKTGFFYVDSHSTQTMSGSGTTWTAFTHLVGASVQVLKNGVLQGTFTVDATGTVSGLSYVNGDVLTGGLAYTSKLKVLPLQGGSPYGSSDMTKKRVHKLILRVYNSINAKVGRDESNLVLHTFSGSVGSESLYTGDKEVDSNTDYTSDGTFLVQCSDPYPLIILSLLAQLHANE